MSNVVTFRTHPSFHGKMENTLEGFIKRVNLWLTQRNSIDADHSGSKYFDHRLDNLLRFMVLAEAEKLDIEINAQRHNFDEEGNSFAYTDFFYTIPREGPCPESMRHPDEPASTDMVVRCKHYFYHLSAGAHNLDWDAELRELMEESIPNADVESIIGNLLMMAQLPGMNLVELVGVVRRKLVMHRMKLLMTEVEKTGTFYVYDLPEGNVLSIAPLDFESDGMLTPLKPARIPTDEFVGTTWCRELAKHLNRTTYAFRY